MVEALSQSVSMIARNMTDLAKVNVLRKEQ